MQAGSFAEEQGTIPAGGMKLRLNGGSSYIDEAGLGKSHGWSRWFVSKWLGVIPLALIMILIAILAILDIHVSMAPPVLFPILNTLFIFGMYSIAAYFAARTFLRTGSWQLLLFGTGILMLGTSATLAAWLSSVGGLKRMETTQLEICQSKTMTITAARY